MKSILFLINIIFLMSPANAQKKVSLRSLISPELSVCEAFQLTEQGYMGLSHSRQYQNYWSLEMIVNDMIPDFIDRKRLRERASFAVIASYSTSAQTATALTKVATIMAHHKLKGIKRKDFSLIMERIYQEKKIQEGIHTCTLVKWGNFYSDLHAWPIYEGTWDKIVNLFRVTSVELTQDELIKAQHAGLSAAQMIELKKIGYAGMVFENQFEFLKDDIGGFKGNPIAIFGDGNRGEFVCTDEMTTHIFFLKILEKSGLLKEFNTKRGKFAHRRPRLFADHFGVLLFTKKDKAVVYDPWIRDGGKFPVIATIDDWFQKKEVEKAFFEDLVLPDSLVVKSLYSGMETVVGDNRPVPKRSSGFEEDDNDGFKFKIKGLSRLRRLLN